MKGHRRGNQEGSIFKRERDGKWVTRLSMGYENGKRIRQEFVSRTRADAAAKLHQAQQQVMNGLPLLDPKLTLGQFMTWWQDNKLNPDDERKERTKRDYSDIIRLHLAPHLGHEKLATLSDRPIRKMLDSLRDKGSSSRRRQYVHAVLRIVLGDAEREGLVHRNVARLITVKSSKRFEIRPYTPEEAERLLDAVKNERLAAIITTALTTGLRQAELLGLTWDCLDIDSEFPKVHVRQNLAKALPIRGAGGRQWWRLETPKTDRSNRVIWLPEMTRQALVKHRENQTEWERAYNFVFTRENGQPLGPSIVGKLLGRAIEAAQLRHQRFHDMRHAAASYWAAMGMSLHEIMGFLGHSSIALTANLYTHLMPAASRKSAALMDKLLGEKNTASEQVEVTNG